MVAGDNERGTPQKGPAMTAALAGREQLNGDTRLLLQWSRPGASAGSRRRARAGGRAAVIAATTNHRDRLLLRVLWAGGRSSGSLALEGEHGFAARSQPTDQSPRPAP